jgi:predicted DNA-binding transcriptional regulator
LKGDQALGAAVMVASIIAVIVYAWLLFFVAPQLLLQLTAFVAVAGVLGIIAWIGWTMATTPPPPPIELEPTTVAPQQEPEQAKSEGKSKKKASG